MNIQLKTKSDAITPDLRRRLAASSGSQKRLVLAAMGQQLVSLSKRAFEDASLRPQTWAPRQDNQPHSLLIKSGTLLQSIRITRIDASRVVIGSDRKYAAAHQLGSKKHNLPARPFIPVRKNKSLTPSAQRKLTAITKKALKKQGL